MKLLIVGSDKVYAIENVYVKHLRNLGVEVVTYNAQSHFFDYYNQGITNKLLFRCGLSKIINHINNEFRRIVESSRPDIIWVFKGMEIYPRSLEWAKSSAFLVNYNPDNPFLFSSKGSGNMNVTRSISLYDLHFTYDRNIAKQLLPYSARCPVLLPFGYELPDEIFKLSLVDKEINKVCFIGNPDPVRAQFILKLAKRGIEIDVFGHKWSSYLKNELIQLRDPVYGEDLWRTLRSYRVQLNLMRVHNEDSHNMRTFEIPAVGGLMVAPTTTDHNEYFEDGKEVFLFSDISTCVARIRELIALDSSTAIMFRNNARARSIDSGYSYENRAKTVFKSFRTLMENGK